MKSKYLPHEFKIVCVRECVATELIDNPELAVKYWRENIPQAPWFDQMKEALVVHLFVWLSVARVCVRASFHSTDV